MLRVEVEWVDSGESRDSGWEKAEGIIQGLQDNVPVISIGWLLHEADDMIVIAHTHDSKHDMFLGALAIWRKNINRISVLRVRKDYDADTFFEKESEEREDRDSVGASADLRSSKSVVSRPDIHWQVLGGSEGETESQGLGHIQGALQRLGSSPSDEY